MPSEAEVTPARHHVRPFNRHFYLLASFVVSLSGCVHVVANPWHAPDDESGLRAYEYLLMFLMVVWLIKDPKLPHSARPSFDHGLLHLATFPLFSAYEQFSIRRWKGIAIVAGLLMMLMAPLLTMLASI